VRWGVFVIQFGAILALALWPWPGWGRLWSVGYCEAANAVVAPGAPSGVRILFQPGDDPTKGEEAVPWQVYVYAQRAATGAVDRFSESERLAYSSLATLVALGAASALQRRKTGKVWIVGVPVVVLLIALNDLNRVVLRLDQWRWLSLGPVVEVALSAAYAFLSGLPVMPFALPGLLWWALMTQIPMANNPTARAVAKRPTAGTATTGGGVEGGGR
jgi:hypothetical protein